MISITSWEFDSFFFKFYFLFCSWASLTSTFHSLSLFSVCVSFPNSYILFSLSLFVLLPFLILHHNLMVPHQCHIACPLLMPNILPLPRKDWKRIIHMINDCLNMYNMNVLIIHMGCN